MATLQIVFDCADPDVLARFWAQAVGYRLQPPPEGWDSWDAWADDHGIPEDARNDSSAIVGDGPRLYFQRVPEAKTVKNRLHLDVSAAPRDLPMDERRERIHAEVTRLTGIGATRDREVDEHGEFFVVMADPEGNEFCVH